jgi:hypothetical protein
LGHLHLFNKIGSILKLHLEADRYYNSLLRLLMTPWTGNKKLQIWVRITGSDSNVSEAT